MELDTFGTASNVLNGVVSSGWLILREVVE